MVEASDDLLDLGWTKLRWVLCAVLVMGLFASGIWVAIRQHPTISPPFPQTESAVMVDLKPIAPPPSAVPPQATVSVPIAEPSQSTSELPPILAPARPDTGPGVPASDPVTPMLPPAPPQLPAGQRDQTAARHPPSYHPHPDRTPADHATSTVSHAGSPPDRIAAPAQSVAPHTADSQTASAPTMAPANPFAISAWRNELLQRLLQAKRYPEEARDRDQQGVVQLRISLDRQGKLLSANLVKSSGFAVLDAAAVATIHRAEPFPEPPPQMPGNPIELTVPVHFALH